LPFENKGGYFYASRDSNQLSYKIIFSFKPTTFFVYTRDSGFSQRSLFLWQVFLFTEANVSPRMTVFERKVVSQFFALFLHRRGAGVAQAV
jgi:hypothetical protein